jgi:MerR family transcriptional regulator/heat shock protein HspR
MNGDGCEPVFIISVAARLLEMHPQTLRKYEREGLVAPSRTSGKFRLYSDEDLQRLKQVKFLVGEQGLNLAGVQLVLDLTRQLRGVQQRTRAEANVRNDEALAKIDEEITKLLAFLGAEEPEIRSRG